MKKLFLVLLLMSVWALPALACDCDTASAVQQGYQDRLHRPFVDFNQPAQDKTKKPDSKTQTQQPNPGQQAAPQQDGSKQEVR